MKAKKNEDAKRKNPLSRRAGRQVQEVMIGNERAVIVPLETWRRTLEELEELHDLRACQEDEANADAPTVEHEELCCQLGLCPLRYLRNRAGLTQEQLSRKTGLSQSYIAKLETGERKASSRSLQRLARALGVKAEKLIYW